jgi:hypothetical protein
MLCAAVSADGTYLGFFGQLERYGCIAQLLNEVGANAILEEAAQRGVNLSKADREGLMDLVGGRLEMPTYA